MTAPNITSQDVIDNIAGIEDVSFLDSGGQKAVFLCRIDGKQYVLKFIRITEDIEDDEFIREDVVARVRREIQIMDRCDHRSLVKLGPIRMTETEINGDKLLYFSEEFVQGEALHRVLKKGPLNYIEGIQLGIDITEAIRCLWDINMIHRDIKPKNIVRKTDGRFVLLDAGIAFDLGDASLTAFGPIGTKLYMSPEQITNPSRSLDFRSDLFLLGITLYESLSGRHPFYQHGMQATHVLGSIIQNSPIPISTILTDVPPTLGKIIMRLLAKQPNMRFRSTDSLLDNFNKAKGEL